MVLFVAVAQPFENLDGVGHGGLFDLNRLEAPLERRVLLEVLAVLLECGGADRLQLTAGQHRLEDAGGVDGALGGTGPDQRVDLVDEEDDVAAGADLLQDLLEPLLEVAAVAGPGDEGTEVERVEVLVRERVRHGAFDDLLGQPSTMAVLPTPGSPMSTGLFLVRRDSTCMTRSISLDRPITGSSLRSRASWVRLRPNWSSTVEPLGAPSLLPPGRSAGMGATGLVLALDAGQQLNDGLADLVEVGAELLEHLGGDALPFSDQAEEDVLGSDVVVAELERLAQRELEHLLGARRERDVAARSLRALTDDLDDLGTNRLEADAHALETASRDTFTLVDQTKKDVLGSDVVVVEEPRLFLGENDDSSSPVGEPFKHLVSPQ